MTGHQGCGGHGRDEAQEALERRVHETAQGVKHKLLVMSGKGGVGKSTVAVNLAVALAACGYEVGLMDVDLHGPSIPGMLSLAESRLQTEGELLLPIPFLPNLKVLSIQNMLPSRDDAVIWRGPMKISVIRQFLGDVQWGPLDYLIVDSPPGTGDEPLTVAQDIDGVRAVVVTTPQEVSLADVRKSLNFCRQVSMPVLGVIENMSGYVCPQCGRVEDLFGSGGGEAMAAKMNVPFLGKIPLDRAIVESGDSGKPFFRPGIDTPGSRAYKEIVNRIEELLSAEPAPANKPQTDKPADAKAPGELRIAVPMAEGLLCAHFGHCEQFALFDVVDGRIVTTNLLTPPPHEPGVIPKWLAEQGATMIIAGGMGSRAQGLFAESGIQVIVGAQGLPPAEIVEQFLQGALKTGENTCDH